MQFFQNITASCHLSQQERWRIIPGHPDYLVSSEGRVASLKRRHGRTLRGWITRDGYHQFLIDGVRLYGHRLVAEAFFGPPPPGDFVAHHIDHDRTANRVENLEWITRAENNRRRLPLTPLH